jgi:hypothetical protein
MIFKSNNNKVTLSLLVLILVLLFCNIKKFAKYFNNINFNTKSNTINRKDNFNNITTSINKKLNEITYGMNPNCLSPGLNNSPYCPNEHANIPCSMTKCNTNLTDEMKKDIYMYIYLTGILEASDIWDKENTNEYWFNSDWQQTQPTNTT